jgi:hypothetical protein
MNFSFAHLQGTLFLSFCVTELLLLTLRRKRVKLQNMSASIRAHPDPVSQGAPVRAGALAYYLLQKSPVAAGLC